MTQYAVGDIQGCLQPLLRLLEQVAFDPRQDQLISVGDLINRGPQSLETLRFCMELGPAFKMVLGNHDLHLLAVAQGVRGPTNKDSFGDVLSAPDRCVLLDWLQSQPLLLEAGGYHMVHAGIPPIWDMPTARRLAAEIAAVLQSEHSSQYFQNMYGNQPDQWSENLEGPDRWRLITNYLTRMRFCTAEGRLELESKDQVEMPLPYKPWFAHERRKTAADKIVFGHWAALQGRDCGKHVFALDTGCVWGGPMRLMNLNSGAYIHQPAQVMD
jgi:bis(5'-nucleosyl)-tetraphosphatase (symmetrical)